MSESFKMNTLVNNSERVTAKYIDGLSSKVTRKVGRQLSKRLDLKVTANVCFILKNISFFCFYDTI
jgi:hypothetical protein